jgi:PAS domain S-box-containing protein
MQFCFVAEDITERKLVELRAIEQAELLSLAPILVRDMQNRIVLWNDGAVEMYGFSKEEATGRISHELLQTQFPKSLAEIDAELFGRGA